VVSRRASVHRPTPSDAMDIIKMAIRFKVLNRDRSIRLVTEGLGVQAFHGHVVLLVNEHTLSAGEMVAAFAKENGLATIVGTTTDGQVLGGANFSVGGGYILRLPAAGWYTWRGAIVEGSGVAPDGDVPLSLVGLREGKDNQLEAAVSMLSPHVLPAASADPHRRCSFQSVARPHGEPTQRPAGVALREPWHAEMLSRRYST
jgi:C-terminal processing protease CtpA/Prc